MPSYDILEEKLKTYMSIEDLDIIKKAYEYALEKHFGQKRLTGEDYIVHPLSVAYILSNIKADKETICAGLLHDVLEDTNTTEEEMKKIFGDTITTIVSGVTKINSISFKGGETEASIANQRKILVGLTEDVRVIIVKLADRLDNMRTLWVHPEEKQKKKARETLDILVPIAHRLGMSSIKSELEELCLRYLKPDVYFDVVEKLNQSKAERDDLVLKMQNDVSELLNEHGIKHEIKGRAKSIYSIYKKLDTGKRFSDIYDLLALRVFVDTEADCYQALGIIHSKFKPIPKRFKDYIAMPKTNMYQSLHTTVFGIEDHLFEIQIRTYEMDEVAEHGIASHWSYKEHKSMNSAAMQNEMEHKLQFFRSIIDLKNEEDDDASFVNSVKEEFKDTIYVFTPKGDVIELPAGSTPIDFAYRVHTNVGEKMVGAIVNNQIVPLDYELKDNDIIKINTNKNSLGPNREWLNMAKTPAAKNKIKSFFNKIDKDEYAKKGEELLAKELRKKKISASDFLTDEHIDKLTTDFKLGDLNEIYINIGSNKITPIAVINDIENVVESKEEVILRKATNHKEVVLPNIKNDVLVDGIDEIKVNIASCCKPVPGDRIVGYITRGNGITIHRMMCPNVKELEERFIDVHWNKEINKRYPTTVLVHTLTKKDILFDIVSKTSNNGLFIESINNIGSSDNNTYDITLLVDNKEELLKFMNDVKSIPEVKDIERAVK
ncbi:MAG: bifunctional (p)ppGpp synthetase/guanosine-3',5'-bis(diphosphate) 3'-pyrophosphohydrolase [Bacilli bacterium]|nr:bifunctional (p)ppGpp synthetase/guanosine-3',5'-bis(diphosphate) 3'-pyrophosphohydrolase [Bacilli bacterium]